MVKYSDTNLFNMTPNGNNHDEVKDQEARAELRTGFLKTISELTGKPCQVLTYEQSELPATFAGWHPDGTIILLNDFETPTMHKTSALLRVPDVIAVKFDMNLQQPCS